MSKIKRKSGFSERFTSLSSQENIQDIHWTSSESSDCDNNITELSSIINNKMESAKRKRKLKVPKSVSNLEVSVIDSPNTIKKTNNLKQREIHYNDFESTVKKEIDIVQNSPILSQKYNISSPQSTGKTRKALFPLVNKQRCVSPILFSKNYSQDTISNGIKYNIVSRAIEDRKSELILSEKILKTENKYKKILYLKEEFDTESNTQHSINNSTSQETNTPTSVIDIEMVSSENTESNSRTSYYSLKPQNSLNNISNENVIESKFKKGGLMYRLDNLLIKQNANISLWEHETYMALSTSFIPPKRHYVLFRIKTHKCNFGCHLIDVTALENNEEYIIIINNSYMKDADLKKDRVLKLFNPFQIIVDQNEKIKLILDACKFVTIDILANNL